MDQTKNKNRVVERERQEFFEIPILLSCEQGNSALNGKVKFKIYLGIHYFEFSCSGFPRSQDKRMGISNIFLSFFTLFLYIP